jgi:o-succinylbenzoate synthase
MRIVDWSCSLADIPTHSQLDTSYGPADAIRPHVFVRLRDDEGHLGLGEASPLPFFTGETAASVKLQLEQTFLPALLDRDPFQHDAIMADLDHLLPENHTAKCAVDMALYDLRGQALGRPVYQQLGGLRRPDGIRVTRAIGIHTLQETVRLARHWVEHGYHALKLKVGPDPAGDIERMRAVRDAIPPDVTMRIDANQGCSLPAALRVARALADAIEYFEQPISARDLAGLRHLREETGVPITVDEAVHGMDDLLRVIDARAADNVVIKLIKCGGLRAAEHLAAVAAAAGLHIIVVSPFEVHIGEAAGLHLALTLQPSPYAHELSVFNVEPRGPLTTSTIQTDGDRILPPTTPGLGARLLEPALVP